MVPVSPNTSCLVQNLLPWRNMSNLGVTATQLHQKFIKVIKVIFNDFFYSLYLLVNITFMQLLESIYVEL